MYDIQLNESGTRHISITDEQLATIKKYALFRDLVDSSGYVTEQVLEKLRLNIRSLVGHLSPATDAKDLLDLCVNVVFHDKMKAFGLKRLILLYIDWEEQARSGQATEAQ